jgi:hypothetical protein
MPYGKPDLFPEFSIIDDDVTEKSKEKKESASYEELVAKVNERASELAKWLVEESGKSKEALSAALAQLEQAKGFTIANILTVGGIPVGLASIYAATLSDSCQILSFLGPLAGIVITGAGLIKSVEDEKMEEKAKSHDKYMKNL